MLQTFLALVHFDGGRFVGWQRQREGRSVQAEFERVLERLGGNRVVAHAAGRTDAGVHAVGLAVSFSLPRRWEPAALRRALNALLPSDCWVESVAPMRPGFHARKSAVSRRYRYDIGTDDGSASPFRRLSEWRERPAGQGVSYRVEADRFLHHMVRMLVGTMVDIGLGRRPVADMTALLLRGDNLETSPPAPAEGLYFVAAAYPADCYLALEPELPSLAPAAAVPP